METFQVVEKFVSINGEGTRAGELAVFIRMKGCNLNCAYCDTTWANQPDAPYTSMTTEEIVEYVKETNVYNVTLTGGEPLLRKGMEELITALLSIENISVEIETNGSVDLTPYTKLVKRPIFTMDYKLGASGMEEKMLHSNFALLSKEDTVKFVSGSLADMARARELIKQYGLLEKCHVYFSPVFGSIEPADMVDFLVKENLNKARIQLQLHKFIWDPNKRGV